MFYDFFYLYNLIKLNIQLKKHRATVDRNALGHDLSIEESKQFRPKEVPVATFNFDETRILGMWVWSSVRGDAKRS